MNIFKRRMLLVAVTGGTLLTLALIGIACIPHLDDVSFLLLPGILISALFFSTGVHSDHPMMFMFLAGITNVIVYATLIGLFYGYLRPSKQI